MFFHGPITYRQSVAVEEHCALHEPPYCWLIYWVPGHPFHRHPVKSCNACNT